jgi:hypothetical protein
MISGDHNLGLECSKLLENAKLLTMSSTTQQELDNNTTKTADNSAWMKIIHYWTNSRNPILDDIHASYRILA